jgi:hypothetical protein
MNRPRLIRWLRISASAACLIACGLLVGLWIRSYSWREGVREEFSDAQAFEVFSLNGALTFAYVTGLHTFQDWGWRSFESDALMQDRLCLTPWDAWESGLYAYDNGQLFVYTIPYWFLLLLSAALAVVPWQQAPSTERARSRPK